MNKTNLLILFLFFFSFSNAQGKDTIYGKVKSIRENLKFLNDSIQNEKLFSDEGDYGHYGFYSAEFTISRFEDWWYNADIVHYINYYKEFDINNKLIKEIWFYKNQDTVEYNEYKYSKSGKLKNHIRKSYSESNTNYKYDRYDNLIEVKTIYSDSDYITEKYTYNSQNLVSETQVFESDYPEDLVKIKNHYDSLGNNIKTRNIYIEGDDFIEEYGVNYSYNEQGKVIEYFEYEIDYDDEKDVIYHDKIKFTYINDLLTERGIYDENDSLTYYQKYEYDDKKRKIKVLGGNTANPGKTNISEYTYANHSLPVKLVKIQNGKRTEIDFEHEFDKNNNWIKQTKIVNGKRLFVWTRDIEYFEN